MKEEIIKILKLALREEAGMATGIELSVPEDPRFGHFSTNVAMRLAKARGKKPLELAQELADKIAANAPAGFFEKVEAVAPGFVNFWMSAAMIQKAFKNIAENASYGQGEEMKGKMVMVEFTDPNPFKLFHIGHLMSNAIGESIARLYESVGATVIRANYQGDVGLHVAKAIWGIRNGGENLPQGNSELLGKMEFLGRAYAAGSAAYEQRPEARDEMIALNGKIYLRSDEEINKLYDMGRKWSLEYFETIYQRLGTKFDRYFFESEMGKIGMDFVLAHKDVFIESEGAIVFPGEKYGLHTRVFINSKGLPTYEAKELGLNKYKFELYPLNLSVIVTGNEISEYFKVLLKAMELVLPDVASKTRHVPHGMLRLPSGKMSSRTGDVVTAEALLRQIKEKLSEYVSEKSDLDKNEREIVTEAIAIGAIKYSILRQNPGQDIVFDFDASLSFNGDSGPYAQYSYARLRSILRKAKDGSSYDFNELNSEIELALMRKILEFSDIVSRAAELHAPSGVVTYLHKLAVAANKFYETTTILKDENPGRRAARLALAEIAARTIRDGLALLGIKAPEKI